MIDIEIFGSHESNTLAQLQDVASRAERAALMADGHLGYVMPIGGVAAYRDKVSVVGVGFDIACGNAAIRTDLKLPEIQGRVRELADEIQASLSFGVGLKNRAADAPKSDPLFEDPAWEAIPDRQRPSADRPAFPRCRRHAHSPGQEGSQPRRAKVMRSS